jgi:hypothetical protein
VREGEVVDFGGRGKLGGGTKRMMRATAARRGSEKKGIRIK